MFVSTKTLKIISAAVYQINKNIQDSNEEKCSYSDAVITQNSSTWLEAPGWLVPQKPWNSCQQQLFKTEETSVQGNRNFYILRMSGNFAINISVSIGSMMAASTTTLQQLISMVAEMLQKYFFIFNVFLSKNYVYLYSMKKKYFCYLKILSFKENIFKFNQNIFVFKIFYFHPGVCHIKKKKWVQWNFFIQWFWVVKSGLPFVSEMT